jgi:hypothetical protein
MLQASLLSSLDRVLKNSKANLSLSQTQSGFEGLPRGRAIITGSTLVQCVLGECWENTDLDIFCTPKVAQAIRSWLVKEVRQMFMGCMDRYVGADSQALAFQNKIHHVEHYRIRPQEGENSIYFNYTEG